jgi:putative nucleotidyltransferase with HDIG domain
MSVHAINEASRTRDSNSLRARPMSKALWRAELAGSAAYLTAAAALALLAGVAGFSILTATVFVLGIALASNARFDVGAGFTVPTQAVFVPMLFALPVAVVPLLVVLALGLGMLPDIVRGRIAPSWLLTAAGNSWFALGPALVLVLAGDHDPGGQVGVLLAALAAQFAFDFAAAAVRDRLYDDDLSPAELLREVGPIYAIDVALSALGLVVALAAASGYGEWPVVLIAPLFLVLRVFSRERQERLEQLAELNDAYQGTALLLGEVVEADDSYTGEHSKSVVRLAIDVAEAIGLDPDGRRNVEFGALLHDVGKIAIPNEIINKPGKLSEREWEIVKTHTIAGQEMLEKIGGFMADIGLIVRASHEAWDGSGYPDGLAGEAIPLEARIVSACDAFNAMTTTRSYRVAMSTEDAVAEMERCAGSHFDPGVVAALLSVVGRGPEADDSEPAASADEGLTPFPELTAQAGAPPTGWSASTRNGELTKALAELAVGVGANVRPGQLVEVSGEVGHLEMVRAVVAAAYDRGASSVDVQIADPVAQWARIRSAPAASLARVPAWEAGRVRELAERGGASILVTGPTFPDLFDGLDPGAVAAASAGPSAQWREATRQINWTIVPAATEGWASRLRPQLAKDEALTALWSDLAYVCRLDEPDPAAAWRARLTALRERAAWLTSLELRSIHFEGPDTDLTVGLLPGSRWERPEMSSAQGVAYVPNLPTEEVYTTPDPTRVEGQVRLTRPVVIGGSRVEDVVLRFHQGRVVDIAGPPGASALREFVSRDPGAARLGELALVDADSRVAQLDRIFGEILLDENAASHIGLGYGFPGLLPSSGRAAANASDHHLDVMIGSPAVRVVGTDRLGEAHVLLRDGRWAEHSLTVPAADKLVV